MDDRADPLQRALWKAQRACGSCRSTRDGAGGFTNEAGPMDYCDRFKVWVRPSEVRLCIAYDRLGR